MEWRGYLSWRSCFHARVMVSWRVCVFACTVCSYKLCGVMAIKLASQFTYLHFQMRYLFKLSLLAFWLLCLRLSWRSCVFTCAICLSEVVFALWLLRLRCSWCSCVVACAILCKLSLLAFWLLGHSTEMRHKNNFSKFRLQTYKLFSL